MNLRTFHACHQAVSSQHGTPPNSFLNQLIDAIDPLPDEVFSENDRNDIYSVMASSLGPWDGLLHRKAAMCEVLRVVAAFESDWNWDEGVDATNPHSLSHIEGQETGAFQVSADSLVFDQSLRDCVDRAAGSHDPLAFIKVMKINHGLAVEYCARLLRFNTRWCGTINDPRQTIDHVRRDAVAEFQTFLSSDSASDSNGRGGSGSALGNPRGGAVIGAVIGRGGAVVACRPHTDGRRSSAPLASQTTGTAPSTRRGNRKTSAG